MAISFQPDQPLYGYVPTAAICYVFVILYSLSTSAHLVQALYYSRPKAWWLLPTVAVAGLAEVIGWGARTKSSYSPLERMPFIIQTSILVLAPTPLVAALFIGFGRIAQNLGPEYSRLKPGRYSKVFLTCDILSLLIQGGGGGMAAGSTNDPDKARLGSNIILAGLGVQLRTGRSTKFFFNDRMEQYDMDHRMKLLLIGITISTLLVYIRSVYRFIEFVDGFNGSLAHNQTLFVVFDGAMVTAAMYTLNLMHPGILLAAVNRNRREEEYALTQSK